MPRNRYPINDEKVEVLLEEIKIRTGNPVLSHGDIFLLQENIQAITRERLSSQTLKRLFGLISDGSKPSLHTLNIAARFLGYLNWNEFQNIFDRQFPAIPQNAIVNNDYIGFYQYQVPYFLNQYHQMCKEKAYQLIEQIRKEEDQQLILDVAWSPASHITFFEWFPDFDGLAGTFKLGLKEYLNQRNDNQAQVYANSLLLLGSFLSENRAETTVYANRLRKLQTDYGIHPCPIARRINTLILDAIQKEQKTSALEKQLETEFSTFYKSLNSIPNFQTITLEHLIIGGRYDLAYNYYQSYPLYPERFLVENTGVLYYQATRTVESLLLMLNGKQEQSYQLFKTIEPANFERNFKDFYGLFYDWLSLYHCPSAKIKQQFQEKVKRTGYTYFNKLVNSLV